MSFACPANHFLGFEGCRMLSGSPSSSEQSVSWGVSGSGAWPKLGSVRLLMQPSLLHSSIFRRSSLVVLGETTIGSTPVSHGLNSRTTVSHVLKKEFKETYWNGNKTCKLQSHNTYQAKQHCPTLFQMIATSLAGLDRTAGRMELPLRRPTKEIRHC